MLDNKKISKIGLGTWGIGGFAEKDSSIDKGKQTDALAYTIAHGVNFLEANMWYAQGYSVEILAEALEKSGGKRKDMFICQAIYLKEQKTLEDAKRELEQVLEFFNTDYVDTIQFNMGSFLKEGFDPLTEWVEQLIAVGKTRYTSITNENLELLKRYHKKFGKKFFSHEVVENFEVRVNEELGIIPYAEKHGIKTVIWRPLRKNLTTQRSWPLLSNLARKYNKTQNQIIINWLVNKDYLTLIKSEDRHHIDENIAALDFKIEAKDLQEIENFRPPGYVIPQVDWNETGKGLDIVQVTNLVDELYPSNY